MLTAYTPARHDDSDHRLGDPALQRQDHGGTSLVLFIAGSVLCGAAWPVGSLIVFPVLQAARKAGPQRIGRVMSLIALPMLVGPVLDGLLIDDLAWR
ncbi:hypothetical protein [Actinoallomurus acaciae]|uniref:MFS transporter n=1 Tax=Actinoallomurus acaciae TaxID=502577 RepID=A0ABV5YVU7_9ACTN